MAGLPDDIKRLAEKAASIIRTKLAHAPEGADGLDGFAKDAAASSRASLVVESAADKLPSAMDADALTKARAGKLFDTMLDDAVKTQQRSQPDHESDLDR